MITRRRFLHTGAATSVAPLISKAPSSQAQQSDSPLFSVGLIADAQYADVKPGGIRYYRKSIEKLGKAASAINRAGVDFSIHLGDIIDRNFSSFDDILEPLNSLKKPVHQILGNHDFSVEEEKKQQVPAKMGIKNNYHAFSRSGIRFLFLDGTEISTFAHPEGSTKHQQATEMLARLKAEKRKNAHDWNAAISTEQFSWLEKQLLDAAQTDEKVIISCHYPILPDNAHNLWNDRELLKLIDSNSSTVMAWLNGHNHAGNYAERKGVHYVTVQGMVNTPDSNAYAVMDVFPDMLRIHGSGRVPDRTLKIS